MDRERRLVGGFALFMGLSAMLAGLASIAGWSGIGTNSCKAICGWAMVVQWLLGAQAAQYFSGTAFLALGAGCAWVGLKLLQR